MFLSAFFLGYANEQEAKTMFCFLAAQTRKQLPRKQNVSENIQKHFCSAREANFARAKMLRVRANVALVCGGFKFVMLSVHKMSTTQLANQNSRSIYQRAARAKVAKRPKRAHA